MKLPPLELTACTMNQAIEALDYLVHSGGSHYVCFCDSNTFVAAGDNEELVRTLRRATMVFPDGIAVLTAYRLQGMAVPERVPGPSLFLRACEIGQQRGWRHFFYGGDTGVPEKLAGNLRRQFPDIQIVGAYSPPFRPLTGAEERDIKQMIEDARPDLLWVALGGPKQEFWMAKQLGALRVPVMLGVGAAFDFHSGNRPWAPPVIRKLGLEWAYRMVTGERRVFIRNAKCVPRMAIRLMDISLQRLLHRPPSLTVITPPGLR